jgi:hypothetical protein
MAAEQNALPLRTSASASNSISGICGGPLWRIAMPCSFASDASPSRNRSLTRRHGASIKPPLPSKRKVRRLQRHPALSYQLLPKFMASQSADQSDSSLLLQFIILTPRVTTKGHWPTTAK